MTIIQTLRKALKQSKELSRIFKVSLDELVDNDIKDVLVEKTSNVEKLAGLILNLIKFFIVFIICVPILLILLRVVVKNVRAKNAGPLKEITIVCNLHDETYSYGFEYYETTGEIKSAGGDGYLINITEADKYGDAYKALDMIDAYVKNNGGTCTRKES